MSSLTIVYYMMMSLSKDEKKMNPVQILDSVETCIAERVDLDCKSYVICWHEGRLKCLPSRAVKNDGNVFLRISADDCKKGLSLEQWGECQKKLANFFEQKAGEKSHEQST